jgi:hypothetical protein
VTLSEVVPTLLLDWHAVAQYNHSENVNGESAAGGGVGRTTSAGVAEGATMRPQLRPETALVVRRWAEQHRSGEVIVLGDPGGRWCRDCAGDEDWDKHRRSALIVIHDLAAAARCPVYELRARFLCVCVGGGGGGGHPLVIITERDAGGIVLNVSLHSLHTASLPRGDVLAHARTW